MRKDSNWDNVDKYVDNCFFDTWNCGNNEGKKGMWIKKPVFSVKTMKMNIFEKMY